MNNISLTWGPRSLLAVTMYTPLGTRGNQTVKLLPGIFCCAISTIRSMDRSLASGADLDSMGFDKHVVGLGLLRCVPKTNAPDVGVDQAGQRDHDRDDGHVDANDGVQVAQHHIRLLPAIAAATRPTPGSLCAATTDRFPSPPARSSSRW